MYTPNNTILKKYADVLIKFALWSGKGIKKGDTVCLQVSESAKPMLLPLQTSVLEAGGNVILQYIPEGISRSFFEHASDEQLTFMPKDYLLSRVAICDHFVGIISENDKHELEGIDPKKIMAQSKAAKFYMDARHKKEDMGKLTWTLGLYGTEAMAKEANMTLEEYWQQIINACFLDHEDPIAKWQEVFDQIETIRHKLTNLHIESVHVEGEDVDLTVKISDKRQWLGGSGRNIPSFEVFISPDWRGTNGWIRLNQPLYRYGAMITGIELKFKDGLVVDAKAKENEAILKEMIAVENADKIGEFSLTDHRFSRITKFMAETLFDENIGGEFGNTHVALGMAYKESYIGDMKTLQEADWKELGFNESVVHTDVISTTDRTVTATLPGGEKKVIYEKGEFRV
ncbi:aminopeptidase [Candidatus Roizmanbacteria bacterium]|nr:aminopeptidase [Candidatus Roizmanbacteria bacterium]